MTAPFGEEQQLQNWFHKPLEQTRREEIRSLLKSAHEKILTTASEGTIEEDVIVRSKKKLFAVKGYSHHIDWETHRILELTETRCGYGVTDAGQLVVETGLVGAKDEEGRCIVRIPFIFGGVAYYTSDTWQLVDVSTIPSQNLSALHAALTAYLST